MLELNLFHFFIVGVQLVSLATLFAIKFNDIKHLDAKVSEVKNEIKCVSDRQLGHEGRIGKIEGRLNGTKNT